MTVARFRTEGIDEIVEIMTKMELTAGEMVDEMLMAGAEEVKYAWEDAIRMHGHIDTGSMLENVNYPRKVKKIGDIKTVDIYPQGKDKKGVRNAEKAFILHYGAKKRPGSHFVDDADDMSGPRVEKAFLKIIEQWELNMGLEWPGNG